MHFICIDKRMKKSDNKTYIILPTGQEIPMPANITQVPALLLLNDNCKIIYGDEIYKHLNPQISRQVAHATQNNMVPQQMQSQSQDQFGAFSGFGGNIVSDQFSFLDSDLATIGNGGARQMHNYVSLDESVGVSNIPPETYESNKIKEGEMEAYIKRREADLPNYR
jgi:hypothetical protein